MAPNTAVHSDNSACLGPSIAMAGTLSKGVHYVLIDVFVTLLEVRWYPFCA